MCTLRLRKIPTGGGNASTLQRNGHHIVATAEATSEVDRSDNAVTPDHHSRRRWRMGDSRMGGIRNVLDGVVGQQGRITIITKSGESGGVAGAPTAPANVQIVDKARRGPKVLSSKRWKTMCGRWNQGTPRSKFSYVRQRSRGLRARPPQPHHTFLAMKITTQDTLPWLLHVLILQNTLAFLQPIYQEPNLTERETP